MQNANVNHANALWKIMQNMQMHNAKYKICKCTMQNNAKYANVQLQKYTVF